MNKIRKPEKKEIVVPDSVRDLKILGVDDEEFNRYLLKVIFDKWGVGFQHAKNGVEAVNKALDNDYDVILMDLRMPEMNGIENNKWSIEDAVLPY